MADERKRAIRRLRDESRALVTLLAYDAATGVRAGLAEGGMMQDEEPGFRAERLVRGTARALADPGVRANLEQAGETIGESLGRGFARGASVELARGAIGLATAVAPLVRVVLVAGAIGLGVRLLLRRWSTDHLP